MTNAQVLQRANEAITRGDHEAFLAFCTEDTTWIFEGEQRLEGKDAVRQWMKESYREPPTFEVERMIEDGDYLAAIGEITLRDESGAPTRNTYCDVWRFQDGRMAELRAFVVPMG